MSTASPDRTTITAQRLWLLTALVAVQLWSALGSLPLQGNGPGGRTFVVEASVLCAALAVFFLRSVPIRWVVRGTALLTGVALARFGELEVLEGAQGSWRVLVWLGATAAGLALAPSSRAVPGVEPGVAVHAGDVPQALVPGDAPPQPLGRAAGRVPVALVVAAVALIGASSLLVGPRMGNAFPVGASVGEELDLRGIDRNSALIARESLDMTTRPRLTDEVVMTVRSEVVSFWRTELYDTWDGSRWTRSRPRDGRFVTDGRITPSPEDLAATRGRTTTQQFRLEVGAATALPAAPSPVEVDTPFRVGQRGDGTLLPFERGAGRGTTYTVRSRQLPLDLAALRRAPSAAEAAPAEVLARYAAPPVATSRVVELAEQVTANARSDVDRIRALEEWMDRNTRYSLDAPLSPRGVDVVDHFLFESRLGWCEQIASSLVVMARAVGIPARLAVGFAPGEWDDVGNRFVVRERDAHAWAEVWFPDAGWVAFDPTADVPLAGTAEATAGAAASDWREVAGSALLVVGVVALALPWASRTVASVVGRWRARRVRRRLVRTRWDVAEEARLERLGAEAGRPRRRDETMTAYAAVLAEVTGEHGLAHTGERIDRARYSAAGADPGD